ncbi:MAG TPA: polysaccharide deacetylase family protein [bacterium]|nr:polysaccharide deacetylase family protein [bacterium]
MTRIVLTAACFFLLGAGACVSVQADKTGGGGIEKKELKKETKAKKEKKEKVVNVLCYHRFEKMPSKGKGKNWQDTYYLSPEDFEEQMVFLKKNANIISMSHYVDYLEGKRDIPDKAVVITIDDGYKSVYTGAFPVLKKYNIPAIVYLYKGFFPGGRNALSLPEVKEMAEAGIEFGCHSLTHPILTSRRQVKPGHKKRSELIDREYIEFLEREVVEAKEYLKNRTGLPIETMAYPYGAYSHEVHHFVKKAGYRAGFSVVPSYNTKETDKYSLKRTMIFDGDRIEKLERLLAVKPLKVERVYPADGSIIEERNPQLKAVLAEDAHLNTATIRFRMGTADIKESVYNLDTKQVNYYHYKKRISPGVHIAKVTAEGLAGGFYEYAWLFIVGKRIKQEFLDGEENKKSEEVTENGPGEKE